MQKTYGLTCVALLIGATSTAAIANTPTPADELKIDETIVIGGNGGVAVKEERAIFESGPITAIRVCHGDRLDSLQVSYGLKQGKKIGGNGGSCDDVEIQDGQKVTAVRVRQGNWIDGIQFQVDGKWLKHYGGLGGIERTERSNGGGALAYIEGRVGDAINQLSFAFGLPYLIKDVKYDQRAIKDQLALAPIERIGWQCFNNKTSVEQEVNKEFSQTVTETASWSFETTTQWGIEAAYSFGVEGIGEASYSASFGQSFSESEGQEHSKEKMLKDSITTKVPPGKKIQTKFVVSKKALNIPFTYTMAHFQNNDRDNIVREKTFSGSFEGVVYTNDNASWEPVSNCEAGSPLEELGTPEEQREAKLITLPPSPKNDPAPKQESEEIKPSSQKTDITPKINPEDMETPSPEYKSVDSESVLTSASYVETSDGGAFSHDSGSVWYEVSSAGEKRFTFEEMDRNEDRIYLFDESRGILIVLDLTHRVVQYAPDLNTEPFDLYEIVEVK